MSERPNVSLYSSGWNPRGVRASWERCSMDVPGTLRFLGAYGSMAKGEMKEAVGWFDEGGRTRVLVADYDSGERLIYRRRARDFEVSIERVSRG